MTARPNTVGQLHSAARRIAPPEARRNSDSFPTSSIPFERSKIAQALIDVAALFVLLLLLSVTAVSIVGAAFILFFVKL